MDLNLRPSADTSRDILVRSRWGRSATAALAVGCVAAAVVTIVQGGPVALLRLLPLLCLVTVASALMWWLPHLVVRRDAVVVANPLTTTHVGLAATERADARLGFSLFAGGRRHHAWAAPARSSARLRRQGPSPLAGQVGAGEFDLDAFDAAALVNNRLEEPHGEDATVVRRWETGRLVVVAVVLVACLVDVLL